MQELDKLPTSRAPARGRVCPFIQVLDPDFFFTQKARALALALSPDAKNSMGRANEA